MEPGASLAESPQSDSTPGRSRPSRKRKYSASSDAPPREYGLMRDTGRNDTSRFVGSASGIHFIRSVYLRLSQNAVARGDLTQGIDQLVPGEDDQIPSKQTSRNDISSRLWDENEVSRDSQADQPLADFELLVNWSKSYFESWHPTVPFLNAGDVLRIFEKVAAGGMAALNCHEQAIVRSVMSISLADSKQSTSFEQSLPSSLVFQTIEDAISASHFTLYQPASMHAIEAALSIQLFLISMLRLNAASRLGGLIVRMAFHLGLHRCPSRYPFFTKEDASMRRRVFWSLYCNERFLSQSLGLPLDIQDDDVDVCFPGEEQHSQHHEAPDSRLTLLTYLSKHARVRGLVLELRNKSISSRDSRHLDENRVRVEMGRWCNEIQDAVEGDEEVLGPSHEVVPSLASGHRLYLQVLKFEAQISLNRPMMAGGPSSESWSQGLQSCISAARSILTILRRHQNRNRVPEHDDTRLKVAVSWPTITWAVWISSFILIYAAAEQQLSLESALRHIEGGKNMLRHISTRQTAWPEYCLSSINTMTAALRDVLSSTQSQGDEQPRPEYRPHSHRDTPRSLRSRTDSHSVECIGQSDLSPDSNASPSVLPTTTGLSRDSFGGSTHSNDVEHQPLIRDTPRITSINKTTEPLYRASRYTKDIRAENQTVASSAEDSSAQQRYMPHATAMADTGRSISTQIFSGREGEESLLWYAQLFANSLGAIDFPDMAAAQFDPSVDPTWTYLR